MTLRENWSEEEVIKLVEGRLKFGFDWEKITSHIGGTKVSDQIRGKLEKIKNHRLNEDLYKFLASKFD